MNIHLVPIFVMLVHDYGDFVIPLREPTDPRALDDLHSDIYLREPYGRWGPSTGREESIAEAGLSEESLKMI